MPDVGSSKKTRSGLPRKARATLSLRFWPPDRSSAASSSLSDSPAHGSCCFTRGKLKARTRATKMCFKHPNPASWAPNKPSKTSSGLSNRPAHVAAHGLDYCCTMRLEFRSQGIGVQGQQLELALLAPRQILTHCPACPPCTCPSLSNVGTASSLCCDRGMALDFAGLLSCQGCWGQHGTAWPLPA